LKDLSNVTLLTQLITDLEEKSSLIFSGQSPPQKRISGKRKRKNRSPR
jgi:hypothetical protein